LIKGNKREGLMSNTESKIKMYNLQDIADMTGIGVQTWRRYIKSGELKASKIGKSYLVFEQNFLKFLESREVSVEKKRSKISGKRKK
jgi:excisionase family DNA binding protein